MPVTGPPASVHECLLTAGLSLQRARVGPFRFANSYRAIQPFRFAMSLGALSGGERPPRRCAPRWGEPLLRYRFAFLVFNFSFQHFRFVSNGFTEPTLALVPHAKYRHGSATPLAGLVSFATAPFHSVAISQAAFPLRYIPTAANCRDRHGQRCVQSFQGPRCSAYRPGKQYGRETASGQSNQQYGARLRLSPRAGELARDASHGQDISNSREIGHFRTASIAHAHCGGQNRPNSR